jgi:hypothetical protein
MNTEINEITINGRTYVEKGTQQVFAENLDGMPYVIVRTYSAGVFAGYLKQRTGQEVQLLRARRLWKWVGAASLSQLAVDGVTKPNDCMFPCEVPYIDLMQAIEIIPMSQKAKESVEQVKVWEV